MMKKDIYSNENLESFVYDLIKYLYKTKDYYDERLSENVLIYSMNKLFYVDENDYTKKINNIPVHIEENINVEDWLEYYNKESLTICMECRLNEYLYYYDVEGCQEVSEKIDKIFKKHGFYYDFGTSYILIAYEENSKLQ